MAESKRPVGPYNNGTYAATMPEIERGANIIKRNRVNYTIPQKVKFGMLPASALDEYMAELEAEKENTAEVDATTQESATESTTDTATASEHVNHTFWEDDDGDRPQLSNEEYEKFLKENAINVDLVHPYMPDF